MQQRNRLKHYSVISILTLFIDCDAASRPINKNVSTDAVTRVNEVQSRAFLNYGTSEL